MDAKVISDTKDITETILKFYTNVNSRCDGYGITNGTTLLHESSILRKIIFNLKSKGIRIRYITEVTDENIRYCKNIMSDIELRHLRGVKGAMAVNDSEYITTATTKDDESNPQLFYSNGKQIVEQQQHIFDILWEEAVSAEQRIKEIEEGIEPIKTVVLENRKEIHDHLLMTIKKSDGRLVCSSIGGMQMIYDNYFNYYRDIIEKQKKGESSGIKWLTYIDYNKDNIKTVKTFLDAGIEVRHIKNLPSMNFSVDSKSIQATIEGMDKGGLMNSLLISNEPAYVKHFTLFFQELWNNYGIDAAERIRNIEEGFGLEDVEIIYNSAVSIKRAWNMVKLAKEEMLLLFSSSNALKRQLKMGVTELLKEISKIDKIKLKILVPNDKDVSYIISELKLEFPYVDIRSTDEKLKTKITILVIDRKESIVWEVKDDSSEVSSFEAVGIAAYTNIKAISLSYAAIFDSLWVQTDMYKKLKQTEQMQKEFLDVAAHELRTPIQPILGLSKIVKNKIKDKEQKELLDIVIKNANKLRNLTEDILDVTKMEGNKFNLNKEALRIVDLVKSIIKEFEYGAESNRKIEFELHFNNIDSNTIIYADRNRIAQVISNLINNSIKFISKDNEGIIIINVGKTKINSNGTDNTDNTIDIITISIKDNGKGIDLEIFPRLFTKFASKSFQGTGLGLYICKNIVDAHGGKIWAKNNEDGKGATFFFCLPINNM